MRVLYVLLYMYFKKNFSFQQEEYVFQIKVKYGNSPRSTVLVMDSLISLIRNEKLKI